MPKAKLKEPYWTLEHEMKATFMAAFNGSRPDLQYPKSASDVQAGIRGILRMFEVKRSALPINLPEED